MFSIFGALIIIFMALYIMKNFKNADLGKNLFFISIISLLILDMGYILKIGNTVIEYNYLFSTINFIFSTYYLIKNKNKFSKKDIYIICFLLFLMISMLIPLIFNLKFYSVGFNDSWDLYFNTNTKRLGFVSFSKHSIGMYLRTLIFIMSFYTFCKQISENDLKKYSYILYNISKIIVIISIVEFIITNFINPFIIRKILFYIFGSTNSVYILPKRTFFNLYSPLLLMSEPSSYVSALFSFLINNYFLLKSNFIKTKKEKKKIELYFGLILFLIFFSKSLSGYIYLSCILLVIFLNIQKKSQKIKILILSIIIGAILIIVSYSRILSILKSFEIINTINPGTLPCQSEIIRFYSIRNNFQLFMNNWIIGCGFGTVYCYSSVITLLSNIGIVGTFMYIKSLNVISNYALGKNYFSKMAFVILLFAGLFIGHMSYILYLETFAYKLLLLKFIDFNNKNSKEKNI